MPALPACRRRVLKWLRVIFAMPGRSIGQNGMGLKFLARLNLVHSNGARRETKRNRPFNERLIVIVDEMVPLG